MNEIKRLEEADYREFNRMSSFAFQYDITDEDMEKRLEKMKLHPDEYWGYYADGKLAAKLILIPFRTWVGGKEFAMGGIAGVSTWPEYRRKGYVAELLRHALATMKEEGQVLSFLHPFSFPFYRKYGWEMYCEFKQYEIPLALMPRYPALPGRVERVEDWRLLNEIYIEYAVRYNGMLVREADWWEDVVFVREKGVSAVWYDEKGRPRGYVRYKVKDKEMEIHELIALDEEARRALWTFIAQHDSMLDKIKMYVPADDSLSFLVSDPRFKQEIHPYFMARVVDTAAFLEQYPFEASGAEHTVVLHVEDVQAEWNRGSFRIDIDGQGNARVSRYKSSPVEDHHREGEGPVPAGLSLDIQTLTALFLGYRDASFLHSVGRLSGSREEAITLDSLISRRQTYLADFF